MSERSECWILGREVTLPNGHKIIGEPFTVFPTEALALAAQKMIDGYADGQTIIRKASLYMEQETATPQDDLWFDGENYWRGHNPSVLVARKPTTEEMESPFASPYAKEGKP